MLHSDCQWTSPETALLQSWSPEEGFGGCLFALSSLHSPTFHLLVSVTVSLNLSFLPMFDSHPFPIERHELVVQQQSFFALQHRRTTYWPIK